MINGLYLQGGTAPFTRLIRVSPQQDTIKIIHRTLDGQRHVQTIGEAAGTLSIDVQVDLAGRHILEDISATVSPLVVADEGATYSCRILELGQFSKPIRGQYRTRLVVAVVV